MKTLGAFLITKNYLFLNVRSGLCNALPAYSHTGPILIDGMFGKVATSSVQGAGGVALYFYLQSTQTLLKKALFIDT